MKLRGVALVAIVLAGFSWVSCGGSSKNGVLYITTQGDGKISTWEVNHSSGVLTKQHEILIDPSSGTPGTVPVAIAMTPKKDALYLADQPFMQAKDGTITQLTPKILIFKIAGDGSLSAGGEIDLVDTSDNTSGTNPKGMVFDSTGNFLFVAFKGTDVGPVTDLSVTGGVAVIAVNASPPTVTLYSTEYASGVANTGVVTQPYSVAVTNPVQSTGNPVTGNHLYVANNFTNTVSAFSFDSNGILTPVELDNTNHQNYLTVGTTPSFVAVSPNDAFLYVANSGDGNISGFQICEIENANCLTPTGALTPLGTPTASGTSPIFIAFEPLTTVNYVYVIDSANRVYEFQYGPASGALKALTTSSYTSTGGSPTWATFSILDPSLTTNQHHFFYVSNSSGHSISGYTISDQVKNVGDTSTGILVPLTSGVFNTADTPTTVVSP